MCNYQWKKWKVLFVLSFLADHGYLEKYLQEHELVLNSSVPSIMFLENIYGTATGSEVPIAGALYISHTEMLFLK